MSDSKVIAKYYIETAFPLEHTAYVLAGEQSSGTFVSVPGETEELTAKHRAEILSVQELEQVPSPSLPGAAIPKEATDPVYTRAVITVSFPLHNFGPSIPNLLATVAGNLYELRELSGIRLMDLELPIEFSERYLGPQFGVDGTRRLTNVYDRPLIGTIVKPSVGLGEEALRETIRALAMAGADFVKDDELNANPPYFPLRQKVDVVMDEINRAAERTGKKMMYAFNITGDIDEMRANHDYVVKMGGNCVMVSINSIGIPGVTYVRSFAEVPIHGHRNQWGAMTRYPFLGMDFRAYQKLCRLAGVDHLHTNGLRNKFFESDESVVASATACLTPMFDGYTVMPVLSSGQWAGVAPDTYNRLRTVDVMHLAGGGIMAHPGGIESGVKSFQQGWEAAVNGVPLEIYAKTHQELQQAIKKFGDITPSQGHKS